MEQAGQPPRLSAGMPNPRRVNMNQKQEIRIKALELHIATLNLLPEQARLKQLLKWQDEGADPKEAIINGAKVFEDFIDAP